MRTARYIDVRDEMRTGDLLLWNHHTLVGGLICAATNSDVNHASAVLRMAEYEGEERRRYHIEAIGKGVVLTRLYPVFAEMEGEAWWYPLKEEWNGRRGEIGRRMVDMVGTPYDFGSVFRNIFGHVSADARRLFCSELWFVAMGFEGKAPRPHELPGLGATKEGVILV